MKKWTFLPAILLATVTIISCNKNSGHAGDEKAAASLQIPSFKVKQMNTSHSFTRFYYNPEGGIDSMVEKRNFTDTITTSHIMYGKGMYTDSIHMFVNGRLVDTWNNFKYNEAGNLTAFTKHYPTSYAKNLLLYDTTGNLVQQEIESSDNITVQHTFRYNQDGDLNGQSFFLFGWEQKWSIKCDSLLNPFYRMPNYFVLANGPDEQQERLSKHNISEVTYEPNGNITPHLNEYDQYGRLIKKTKSTFEWYTLTYY